MLHEDRLVPIHVAYSVEKENENETVYHCKVMEEEIPEWMGPQEFKIRVVYSPGVTITELSSIPIKTVEMGTFVDETFRTIRVNELNEMRRAS